MARLDEICDLADRYQAWCILMTAMPPALSVPMVAVPMNCEAAWTEWILSPGPWARLWVEAVAVTLVPGSEVVELLRQRSRPYLFSNTVAPPVVAGAIKALELVSQSTELRDKLAANTAFFREGLQKLGFKLWKASTPSYQLCWTTRHWPASLPQLCWSRVSMWWRFLFRWFPRAVRASALRCRRPSARMIWSLPCRPLPELRINCHCRLNSTAIKKGNSNELPFLVLLLHAP